ncbi:hypothetical protein AZE42_13474 [Rhizopogon vesiculosus]|uniref:Uncharacterized protein n=1 Tax=Rhizopogon vesiculosus TaxID=180088 RepID=A0A1J8QPE1_9AGAM|nr:hypothetical protein AZE42_13474 [Rhizopogon vesiculosus]
MTGGGVATLYPEFTLHGKNICADRIGNACTGESQIGSLKATNLILKSDSSFLGRPCDHSCPSVWRSFTEYVRYEDGVYNWDTGFDVREVFKEFRHPGTAHPQTRGYLSDIENPEGGQKDKVER